MMGDSCSLSPGGEKKEIGLNVRRKEQAEMVV